MLKTLLTGQIKEINHRPVALSQGPLWHRHCINFCKPTLTGRGKQSCVRPLPPVSPLPPPLKSQKVGDRPDFPLLAALTYSREACHAGPLIKVLHSSKNTTLFLYITWGGISKKPADCLNDYHSSIIHLPVPSVHRPPQWSTQAEKATQPTLFQTTGRVS